jgi:hypothetical protein
MTLSAIPTKVNEHVAYELSIFGLTGRLSQRSSDGYVNAGELSVSFGRKFDDWLMQYDGILRVEATLLDMEMNEMINEGYVHYMVIDHFFAWLYHPLTYAISKHLRRYELHQLVGNLEAEVANLKC